MGEVRTYWILRAWVWGPDEGTCVGAVVCVWGGGGGGGVRSY